jgi:hypothetical protein
MAALRPTKQTIAKAIPAAKHGRYFRAIVISILMTYPVISGNPPVNILLVL